jgi:polar amino acid transport system substrate-binding protein
VLEDFAMGSATKLIAAAAVLAVASFLVGCGSSTPSTTTSTLNVGKCKTSGTPGKYHLTTVASGALTALVTGPPASAGDYIGTTIDNVDSGYGYCMLVDIAYRSGLSKVILKSGSTEALTTGAATGYDIAFNSTYITAKRALVVDFTPAYEGATTGVMVLKTDTKINQQSIHQALIGVGTGSVQYTYVTETLKATQKPKTFDDASVMPTALLAGKIDCMMLDIPDVLSAVGQAPDKFKAIGQYDTGNEYGGVMPKGSPNKAAFTSVMNDMLSDGTIKGLIQQYESTGPGLDPTQIPFWTP